MAATRIFLQSFFIFGIAALFAINNATAQKNLELLSHFSFAPGNSCAGVWYYVDSLNREYALVGTKFGLVVVDVTQPTSPNQLFLIPGNNSNWREVRTWGKFAYVTTETIDADSLKNGLQIINLSYLPDSVPSKIWKGDGAIANQLQKAHAVNAIDGYVYIFGSNLANGGVLIANLIDPWNPQYAGQYNQHYVHDCFVRGDTMWTSEIFAGQFSVVNITDRANPIALTSQPTPSHFNHNGWMSDDNKYFFTTDEVHNAPVASFDVSDIWNITLLDTYRCINMDTFEVHNVRFFNDYLICPSYGSQVTIVDVKRPENMVEVGNYPTGNSLCWDAVPYLPSGNIIATDKGNGLFVLAPTYIRACYLEGIVKDSATNLAMNKALIEILSTPVSTLTDFTGNYKTGYSDSGLYNVQFSADGYCTKTVSNVTLTHGAVTILDVVLKPGNTFTECNPNFESSLVFPNPVSGTATIRFTGLNPSSENVFVLIDVLGKIISETNITNAVEFVFERRSLAKGMYIYKVMSNGSSLTHGKILVD